MKYFHENRDFHYYENNSKKNSEQLNRQEGFINVKTYKALMYLQGCIQMMIHEKFKHLQTDFLYPSSWRKICKIKQGRGVQRKEQK